MTNPTSPLKFLTHQQLHALNIPPRIPILGEWMTERHPCMVYAQTGRGKSLFAMSVAIAVAGGGSVFGWEAPEPRPVLYVDAEMDIADVVGRDKLLVPSVGGVDTKALDKNLTILARHHQPDGATFPDLVEEAGREALLDIVRKLKPALVILDNLSTLAEIKDENDAASFTPILKMLWELRRLDCAVMLVHHTGKQEGKYRGSSKLAATFESIIQLGVNNDLLQGDTGFTIRIDKFRGGQPPKPLKVKLEVDKKTGAGRWDFSGLQDRNLQELVKAAQSREFQYGKAIAEHLGISTGEVSKRKHKAIAMGLITGDEWEQCFQDARDTINEFPNVLGMEDGVVGVGGAGSFE